MHASWSTDIEGIRKKFWMSHPCSSSISRFLWIIPSPTYLPQSFLSQPSRVLVISLSLSFVILYTLESACPVWSFHLGTLFEISSHLRHANGVVFSMSSARSERASTPISSTKALSMWDSKAAVQMKKCELVNELMRFFVFIQSESKSNSIICSVERNKRGHCVISAKNSIYCCTAHICSNNVGKWVKGTHIADINWQDKVR